MNIKLYFEFLGWLFKRYTFKISKIITRFCEIIDDEPIGALFLWAMTSASIILIEGLFCLGIDSLFPYIRLICWGSVIFSLSFYFICIIKVMFDKFDRERGRLFEELKK